MTAIMNVSRHRSNDGTQVANVLISGLDDAGFAALIQALKGSVLAPIVNPLDDPGAFGQPGRLAAAAAPMMTTIPCQKCACSIEVPVPLGQKIDVMNDAIRGSLAAAGWVEFDPMVGWACKACTKKAAAAFEPMEIGYLTTNGWKTVVCKTLASYSKRCLQLDQAGTDFKVRSAR